MTRDLANLSIAGLVEKDEATGHWRLTPRLPQQCFKIAAEIERNLDILATEQRGVPDRQRSIRAVFDNADDQAKVLSAVRYVDNKGEPTEVYPYNPNGSPGGLTAVTTADGRFTIMMPHPERVFRTVQMSWHPENWCEDSPWLRMFRNARRWVG